MRYWQVGACRPCTLSRRLPSAIHSKDEQVMAVAIQESTHLVAGAAMRDEVILEDLPKRITTGYVDIGQETTERCSVGQVVPAKARHKRLSEWQQSVKEGRQGRLATGGIAEQNGNEVDDIEHASATASKVQLLADGVEMALLREMPSQDDDFGKPGRDGWHVLGACANLNGWYSACVHRQLLHRGRDPACCEQYGGWKTSAATGSAKVRCATSCCKSTIQREDGLPHVIVRIQ